MTINQLKKLIIGTPLEEPARSFIRLFRHIHKSEWTLRTERDAKNTERLLRNFLRKNSHCVDIGANRGLFLKRFTQLAPEGKHYAFEPLPELARVLSHKFPNVEVFNCALSNRTGKATFYYVPKMDGWSGLQKQNYPTTAEPIEIQVELKRLDDITGGDVQVDFMKIDVEGAELEVLKGAELTIKRCHPLVLFEHARIHNENYETTPDMVYDFLVGTCGLEIWDLELSRTLAKNEFREIYESSFASNYDRNAQTNFVARPPAALWGCRSNVLSGHPDVK